MNTLEFYRLRWHFEALGRVWFPSGESGNILRGAFGLLLRRTASREVYQRLFEPGGSRGASPSGLKDWPRPFVFRTAAVDGREIAPGGAFHIDMHVFDCRPELVAAIRAAFEQVREAGLGQGRGRAALQRLEQIDLDDLAIQSTALPAAPSTICLDPDPGDRAARVVQLRFVTPTELKGDSSAGGPEFGVLFARLRDRVATLRALYGAGPLDIDFRSLGGRAGTVKLVSNDLQWAASSRRSSRTGQSHPLGGFTGEVEYTGELAEFLPWLRAARWTGVGRQTVWGKGDVHVIAVRD